MNKILLTKEMQLHFKNDVILHKIPQTHMSRMSHMCFLNMEFANRILKCYLRFTQYDELFAKMIFLDMFRNGSGGNPAASDFVEKQVILYQRDAISRVTVQRNVNRVEKKENWYENRIVLTDREISGRAVSRDSFIFQSNMFQKQLAQRLENNQINNLTGFSSAVLQSIDETAATLHFSVLHVLQAKNAFYEIAQGYLQDVVLAKQIIKKAGMYQENTANFVDEQERLYCEHLINYISGQKGLHQRSLVKQGAEPENWYQNFQSGIVSRTVVLSSASAATATLHFSAPHALQSENLFYANEEEYLQDVTLANQIIKKVGMYQENTANFVEEQGRLYREYLINHIQGQEGLHQRNLIKQVAEKENRYQNFQDGIASRVTWQNFLIQNNFITSVRGKNSIMKYSTISWMSEKEKNNLTGFSSTVLSSIDEATATLHFSVLHTLQIKNAFYEIAQGYLQDVVLANQLTKKEGMYQGNIANLVEEQGKLYCEHLINHIPGQEGLHQRNLVKQGTEPENWYQNFQSGIVSRTVVLSSASAATATLHFSALHALQSENLFYAIEEEYLQDVVTLANQIIKKVGMYQENTANFVEEQGRLYREYLINHIPGQEGLHQRNLIKQVAEIKNRYQNFQDGIASRVTWQNFLAQNNFITSVRGKNSITQYSTISRTLEKEKNNLTGFSSAVLSSIDKVTATLHFSALYALQTKNSFYEIAQGYLQDMVLANQIIKKVGMYQENTANLVEEQGKLYHEHLINRMTGKCSLNPIAEPENWYQNFQSEIAKGETSSGIIWQNHLIQNNAITSVFGKNSITQYGIISRMVKKKNKILLKNRDILSRAIIWHLLPSAALSPIDATTAMSHYSVSHALQNENLFYANESRYLKDVTLANQIIKKAGMFQGNTEIFIEKHAISYQNHAINAVAEKRIQYQRNLTCRVEKQVGVYRENLINHITGQWKTAAVQKEDMEDGNKYSKSKVYARKNGINEKIISAVQWQIKNMVEKFQEDLTEEKEKNISGEEMLKKLERKMLQQEEQIKELKTMYGDIHSLNEEDKNDQLQEENYAEMLDNSLKLERMRYGVS